MKVRIKVLEAGVHIQGRIQHDLLGGTESPAMALGKRAEFLICDFQNPGAFVFKVIVGFPFSPDFFDDASKGELGIARAPKDRFAEIKKEVAVSLDYVIYDTVLVLSGAH